MTIAAGTALAVGGDLNLFSGTLNQSAATGIVAALGNVNVQVGFTGGGTATVALSGTGSQTITGFHTVTTGALPNVDINKPSGILTVAGTLRTARNWTFTAAPGGLVATGSTVVFTGGSISGSHALNAVEIRGTVTIAAGTTLTANGVVNLFSGTLNQSGATGTLAAHGNVDVQVGFTGGGTATLLIAGTGSQTMTGFHTAAVGALLNVDINKPAGGLTIAGILRTNRNWTYTAAPGGLVAIGSTVVFNGTLAITGSHALNNVELRSGTVTIAAGTTVTVMGLTTLTDGDLNGGTLEAHGNVNLAGTFDGETGTLRIAGTTNQTLSGGASTTVGDVANVLIDKPSGTLFIVGTIRISTAAWTWLQGAVDAGTSLLVLEAGTTISGSHTLHDIHLRGGAHTVGAGMPTAGGTLTLEDGTVDGGTLGAAGAITQLVTFDGGSGTLVVVGAADQTFTGASIVWSGDLPNIDVDKTAGTLTLAGTLRLDGANWVHTGGAVDAAASTVVFSGTSGIGAPGMAFNDLTVNGGVTTLSADLDVDDELLVMSASTLDAAGFTVAAGGDMTVDGSFAAGGGALLLDGAVPQTLGGASAAIGLFDLTTSNPAGVSLDLDVQVDGTLTLNGPIDFGGQLLGIANPIAGTPTNLTGNPASALEVFGIWRRES